MTITGIHHVTAVTATAAENLAFYTELLGMRLVKKTVNQDDVSAYHLFYADAEGNAGTELTFFDWPFTAPRQHGPGTVTRTELRVPDAGSLEWWASRLAERGVAAKGIAQRAGRAVLDFEDAEGQRLALVDAAGYPGGVAWSGGGVPAEHAIRGLGPVTIRVAELDSAERFLPPALGFRRAREDETADGPLVVFEMGEGGTGAELHVEVRRGGTPGRVGRGGVHHVAFRVPDDTTHAQWQRRLHELGVGVTPVIDRFYFRSIYFRGPEGVLFEIATDGPGFATDEDMEHLGERLALPPFLEPRRAEIEAGLVPLPSPAGVR